ncbi:MAG: hypothetical protein MZU84_00215 [Sphingobacterium sp.]|nr:hypothetical protein [Sphingobacterium sp.]
MEKNELAGSKPSKLAARIVRIVEKKNPKQTIFNRSYPRKTGSKVKIFSAREVLQMDPREEL